MSESNQEAKQPAAKLGSRVLREQMGGVPNALLQFSREQAATHKSIRAALKNGPRTVPELAGDTGIAARDIFWNVVALVKYGKLERREEQDGYYLYALPSKREKDS